MDIGIKRTSEAHYKQPTMRLSLSGTLLGTKWKTLVAITCLFVLLCINIFQERTNQVHHNDEGIRENQELNEPAILVEDIENLFHLKQELRRRPRKTAPKKILLWTTYFGSMKPWIKIFSRLIDQKCPESHCILKTDKTLVGEADALIFNGNDLLKKQTSFFEPAPVMPPKSLRKSSQVYVFMTFEAPTHFENNHLTKYDNFFNWTMTYRRDSDVYAPYGSIHPIKSANIERVSTPLKKRTKMALWMASHCSTHSKRESLVRELKKYIDVDIYGSCGDKKCGKQTILPNMLDQTGDEDPCDRMIGEYKFYLAFENSICPDYVTEKFFRALKHGAIPIVMGGANYSAIAPPNSYIDSLAYDTVEKLADHMKEVANNETLFHKYSKWRENYTVDIGHPYQPMICDLCKKLHEQEPLSEPNIYKDIAEWHLKKHQCYRVKLP